MDEREGDLQTDRGQQYLKLLQREKEMSIFLKSFPHSLEQVKEDLAQCQRRVWELLSGASRDLEGINDLPNAAAMKTLEGNVEAKRKQLADAKTTAEKLMLEVELRRTEYENLAHVDVKIAEEIQAIKQQMKQMEDELPGFGDVEGVREEGEIRKQRLIKERDQLKLHLHHLRKATNGVATRYNEARASLRGNDVNNKLHECEKEIRSRAAEAFSITETIEDNRRRTNYSLVKRSALNVVNEVNNLL
jgi:intraflagellar transport protein 74